MTSQDGSAAQLTPVEQRLVDHVVQGEILDLAGSEPTNETAMASWDATRTVRASVLRDILRGQLAPDADPRGLRLRGAAIDGRIDLAALRVPFPLLLADCRLDHGLVASGASLNLLSLAGCRLRHPSEPALEADGLQVEGIVDLSGMIATGDGGCSTVCLEGARCRTLDCTGARVTNATGPALDAEGIQVAGNAGFRGGFRAVSGGASDAVCLFAARIGGNLSLDGARLCAHEGSALSAGTLQVDGDVWLTGEFKARSRGRRPTASLFSARIGGMLDLTGARLRSQQAPALSAYGLQAEKGISLSGLSATGNSTNPLVNLSAARSGLLHCNGAKLTNLAGPVMDADSLRVTGTALFNNGFKAVSHGQGDAVRLFGARIGGHLTFVGARLRADGGSALSAFGMQVDGVLHLTDVSAKADSDRGAVDLARARCAALDCANAHLTNRSGPALSAWNLRVAEDATFQGGFRARGRGDTGAVELSGARIGGNLDFASAHLDNKTGPALFANSLQVTGTTRFRNDFKATGRGDTGAVELRGARIGGNLDFASAHLDNKTGPALFADSLQVTGDTWFRNDFKATGRGEDGAAWLANAHFAGELGFLGASLVNDTGPALLARGIQVGKALIVRDLRTRASGRVAIDLSGAHVAGVLEFSPAETEHPNPQCRFNLDGLVYSGLPQGKARSEWPSLLRSSTPRYAAQPYQQLANAYKSAGHDREARYVLRMQRRDQIARVMRSPWERTWARFTGWTLGYGYQPWRALAWLFGIVVATVLVTLVLAQHGALTHTVAGRIAPGCPTVDQVGSALNFSLPLIKFTAGACSPAASKAGQALTVIGWTAQVLAWAFATLFVAGFTSAVRKS